MLKLVLAALFYEKSSFESQKGTKLICGNRRNNAWSLSGLLPSKSNC